MLGSQEIFEIYESFQMSGPMVSSRKSHEPKKKCSLKRKDAAAAVTKGFQIEESISTKFPLRPDVSARKLSCSMHIKDDLPWFGKNENQETWFPPFFLEQRSEKY